MPASKVNDREGIFGVPDTDVHGIINGMDLKVQVTLDSYKIAIVHFSKYLS